MVGAPIEIANKEYVGVVVIRRNKTGDTRLYIHEVTVKQKLLDGSSNPALIPVTNQGVMPDSPISSSNPTSMLATNQGDIAKVLQKIIFAKSE